jgi:hypothetical protein
MLPEPTQRMPCKAQRAAARAWLNKAHQQIHQLNLASNEGMRDSPER